MSSYSISRSVAPEEERRGSNSATKDSLGGAPFRSAIKERFSNQGMFDLKFFLIISANLFLQELT